MDAKLFLMVMLMCSVVIAETVDITIDVPEYNIAVMKQATEQLQYGGIGTATITITNNHNEPVDMVVKEYVGEYEITSGEQLHVTKITESTIYPSEYATPYMRWELKMQPGEKRQLSYKFKPKVVGDIVIGQTVVTTGLTKHLSEPAYVEVECTSSPECNYKIGESDFTCPKKMSCRQGAKATPSGGVVTPPNQPTITQPGTTTQQPTTTGQPVEVMQQMPVSPTQKTTLFGLPVGVAQSLADFLSSLLKSLFPTR